MSASTRSEVGVIASIIDASSLGARNILSRGADFDDGLFEIFPAERAERAVALIDIVAEWAGRQTAESRTTVAEVHPRPSFDPVKDPTLATGEAGLTAPAFLRSDQVDDEDSARLYGSAGSYLRVVGAALSVLLLGAVGVGVWLWANSTQSSDPEPAGEADVAADEAIPSPGAEDSLGAVAVDSEAAPVTEAAPTAAPVTVPPLERVFWADTTTVLNSGSGNIVASTYPVSAANRAVLVGHAAAITGIAITDDGRVLTSGADEHLVDWGIDVTLTRPDVLEIGTPLTALTRTADERLIAGDNSGNITVINLRSPGDPVTVAVHASAIASLAEIGDGRIAVASVDGEVALLHPDTPGDGLSLPHDVEVTSVTALNDGSIATAAVDGLVRIWSTTGGAPIATISSLGAPATAVTQLSDDRLAIASVGGTVQIVPAVDGAQPDVVLQAHAGAVRALLEFEDGRFGRTLASAGDDSSIVLHAIESGTQWQQLDGHGDLISALALLPDGRLLSTSADGTGRVWDLDLLGGPVVETPHEWNLSEIVAWRNDQFITGGADGRVMLASTTETVAPDMLVRHDAPIVGLTVMPNGDIVSLDAGSTLRLMQVGTEAAESLEVPIAPGATSLAHRGDQGIVTGHADGTVRFSDLTQETAAITAHGSSVNAVLGLSNGLVLSAGADNTVRVIDPDEPDFLPVFDLHSGPVTALAELPDGRVASAGPDGIYVWNIIDMGAEYVRLSGHSTTVLTLHGLSDGRLVSTGIDGRVRLWDLQAPELEAETLVDIPGVVNPHFIQADNGLLVAGAGRGYVVFTIQ